MPKVISNWKPEYAELADQRILKLRHNLHESPHFSDEALSQLIETYPREYYNVHTMDTSSHDLSSWREGEIGNCSGQEVLESVERGRLWLNMRNISEQSKAYQEVTDHMFEDFESFIPDFKTFKRSLGILVSSSRAQCYYHFDIPGQMLWQIRGRKKVYVYEPKAPFLSAEDKEKVILNQMDDLKVRYEDWFDDHCDVIEIGPGDMLFWPLNSPHKVANLDCMNISLTTEHYTNDIRGKYAVNYANGLLRNYLGMKNLSQEIRGPAYYAKMALAGAHKYSGIQQRLADQRTVDFQIDPKAEHCVRDVEPKDFSSRCVDNETISAKLKAMLSGQVQSPQQMAG